MRTIETTTHPFFRSSPHPDVDPSFFALLGSGHSRSENPARSTKNLEASRVQAKVRGALCALRLVSRTSSSEIENESVAVKLPRGERYPAWLLPLGLLMVAIVAVPLRLLDESGLPRFRLLESELEEVEQQNDELRREVESLMREVQGLESDPAAIERVARDELGMIHEGEVVFQFDVPTPE